MDFFHKGASMTKRVVGIAKLKNVPKIDTRQARRISKVGTFYDEEDPITSILLEVASDEGSRKRGMMGRDRLPDICGMLFEGLSGGGSFWMKNCLIPLDVAFMTKDWFITKTYSMPVDKEGNSRYEYGNDDVSAVEVPMGFLGKWGIVPGFRLKTRDLSSRKES